MTQKLFFAVILLWPSLALFAQTPVPIPITGNLGTITGSPAPDAVVKLQLANCSSGNATITGYMGIVQMSYSFIADGSGNINGTVWPNDLINCSGTTGATQYTRKILVNDVPVGQTLCYSIRSTQGTWNLNTQQPVACSTTPPNNTDGQFVNLNVTGCLSIQGGPCGGSTPGLPLSGGTLTGPLSGTSATFTGPLSSDITAWPASSPAAAINGNMVVQSPGVFGYAGGQIGCTNVVEGGICYGLSTMAIDASDGLGYTHTVGYNPQVVQHFFQTPGPSGSDLYGVAAGFGIFPGIWPGSGFRVEGQPGASTTQGQIQTAYDTTDGISPTLIYGRPGCRLATCRSMDIRLQGRNAGVTNEYTGIFQDNYSNLWFNNPADVFFAGIHSATSSINYASPGFHLTANGWNGTGNETFSWTIRNNVNATGTVYSSQLIFAPPPDEAFPSFIIQAPLNLGLPDGCMRSVGGVLSSTGIPCANVVALRVASCATGTALYAGCNTTVTWPSAFADLNYTYTCFLEVAATSGGAVLYSQTALKTASSVQITVENLTTGSPASGVINCTAKHD